MMTISLNRVKIYINDYSFENESKFFTVKDGCQ